jgi:hypothetical protein
MCPAAENGDAAIAVAKDYIGALKAGEYREAVSKYWNTNVLLSASFGLTYVQLPAAERTRAQAAFAEFVAAPFAHKHLTDAFKNLVIQKAAAEIINPSTVAVRLEVEFDAPGGEKSRIENTLLLVKSGDGWRIIDQRQADQVSLRVALTVTFIESRGENGTIPEALERAAAEVRKQATAQ